MIQMASLSLTQLWYSFFPIFGTKFSPFHFCETVGTMFGLVRSLNQSKIASSLTASQIILRNLSPMNHTSGTN